MSEYIVDLPLGFDATRNKMVNHQSYGMVLTSEPIVRCKDCKHFAPAGYKWDKYADNNAKHDSCIELSYCDYEYDYIHWFQVEPDNFCAWGERKEQ